MLLKKPLIVAMLALSSISGVVQAAGNVERGADLTYDCIECHGMDGKGSFETPSIAGKDQAWLLKRLRDFYSGNRKSLDNLMHIYTEDRSDQDLQDLAAYYAFLKK